MNQEKKDLLREYLECNNEVYLATFDTEEDIKNNDYCVEEVHDGGYYVGSDEFEFSNDSNIGFEDIDEVVAYYSRNYAKVEVFESEEEREEVYSRF